MITITIYRNWLALEVETETRKASFLQINGDATDARLEASKGKEFSDEAYFVRKVEVAIASLTSILHKFVTQVDLTTARATTASNQLDYNGENDTLTKDNWVIKLNDDKRRNLYSRALANAMHKYIVSHMLCSWSVAVYPNLTAEYKSQLAACETEIEKLIYRKELPTLE